MDTILSKALREFFSGPLNQLIVNLAGKNGGEVENELKKFNRGEPCWVVHEIEEIITRGWSTFVFPPIVTGWPDLPRNLLKPRAQAVLKNHAFVVTNGKTYKLGMIKGSDFRHKPTNEQIRSRINFRGGLTPFAESALYLREPGFKRALEKIGVNWIVIMHDPIRDNEGNECLLCIDYNSNKAGAVLQAGNGKPDDVWDDDGGFVYLLPE